MKQSPPSYLQDAGEEDIHSDFDVHVDTGMHGLANVEAYC